ncbi:MAG: hypothetical protein HKN73_19300 [Gemmatimonadetes bacterium]|nr:hypothetical protein [Gemmatimonadota bacterium]
MPKKQYRDYRGQAITIRFEPGRCIHAEECVKGAPAVFDAERRPWIDPDGDGADHVAAVIMRCPTGALQFERLDGGEAEPDAARCRVRVVEDGPLYVTGNLSLSHSGGERRMEKRVALCRCGASKNKPFCDNSHIETGFTDPAKVERTEEALEDDPGPGSLELSPAPDGPMLFTGPVLIQDGRGEACQVKSKGAFCRCGASGNKPFCDGSHRKVGFTAP